LHLRGEGFLYDKQAELGFQLLYFKPVESYSDSGKVRG